MKFVHNRCFGRIDESVTYYDRTMDESKLTANLGITKIDRGELRKISSELMKKSKKSNKVLSLRRDFSGNDSSGYSAEYEDKISSSFSYSGDSRGSASITSVSYVSISVNTSDKTVTITYRPIRVEIKDVKPVVPSERCKGLTKVISYSKLVQFPYSDIKDAIAQGIDLCRAGLDKLISRFMSVGIKNYESGHEDMRGNKYPSPDSSTFYSGLAGIIDDAFNGSVSKITLNKAKSQNSGYGK